MSVRRLLCIVFGLSITAGGIAFGHPGKVRAKVVTVVTIEFGTDRSVVQRLAQEDYDIAGVNLQEGTVDVVTHSKEEGLSLAFFGFNVKGMKTVDQTVAPDQNYKTPAEIEAALRQYAASYPAIVRMETIGRSHENREIFALKITDNPDQREVDEPRILFNSMHHAREIMTPEVALDTIEMLVTGYGQNADATRWVEGNEIWIVPMLNVDGNNKVWNGSSLWRKNTFNGYGVDINRNYPFAWNTCNGSSGSTFSDTYRGPSAGSEPEVQALMGLVARIQPVFNISYHSYSELVIYPYGCQGQRSETREVVEMIGRELAGAIVRDNGRGTYDPGTAWELLYSVDGGDIDWMYNVHNVIPYVIELNSSSAGFQPNFSLRQPTVEKLRPGWTMLLNRLEGSGVRGFVSDGAGRAQPQTTVTVSNLADPKALATTQRVKADGTYHLVLNPGMYRLSFELGGQVETRDVTIGADRVEMDVQF
jgi:carboxypeptidase T